VPPDVTAIPPAGALKGDHPPDGYVFIVTYGRSGSTLLQHLLNCIDGIVVRGENNNTLWHLFQAWHALDSAGPINDLRVRGAETDSTRPWFGAELIDPDAVGHDIAGLFRQKVLNLPTGTRMGGFKEIRVHSDPELFPVYLDFIARFFPGSRFVFNTRAHEDVARSAWWGVCDPDFVRATLAEAEALFRAYAAAHPATSLILHYDDYIRDRDALAPLFALVGDRPSEAQVQQVFARQLQHGRNPAFRT